MSSEWKPYSLADLVSFKTGKLDSNASENGGIYPFFTCSPITLGINSFAFDTEAIILAGNNANGVFSAKYYSGKFNAYQRTYVIEPLRKEQVNCRFMYFFISHKVVHLKELSIGTTTKFLTMTILNAIQIKLPSKPVQDRIAELLSALDDRIALLRETNTTLETIAQALFKSWFVDFDPVRAKQEGREPEGMDADTAALFPDSFEESELGFVPKGWRVGKFGELARLHKGSINPLKQFETIFEHYSLPAFDNGQMPVTEAGTEIKSNKTSVPVDSILLSKLNPHIPRVWLPSEVGNNSVCSTEFLVFVPEGAASKEFIYCYFTTALFQQLLCQLVTGTSNSHQRIKPDAVAVMPAVIPLGEVLKSYELLSKPIFERFKHNRKKAQTLATLRDTLLPRLISGQLRLPDAEALVGDV